MSPRGKKGMETIADIAQSRIIIFRIGDRTAFKVPVFNVHEASVLGLSERLDEEILKQTGKSYRHPQVDWAAVHVCTFTAFLQYAYTGDFAIISNGMKQGTSSDEPPSLGESMASCESILQQSASEEGAGPASSRAMTTMTAERGPSYSRYYYLQHCRLYIFADKYDLEKLKALCVEKPETEAGDAMRKLFFQYVLTDMAWMMKQPVFNKLLKEMPEISHELLFMVPLAYWKAV
ncbi:hypothetical protein LX32DRAFT_705436 [Colletotrichum zoysiae]|uniref:BTB domain-containing protein n=1 Tax=Colletotrichum zoysiae TaxID=1216348 RepID=A0AAD9M007_9PEZI|nr:hypothetical protein LX32DRAFT_705436 [Colletotrichum zoysiae]